MIASFVIATALHAMPAPSQDRAAVVRDQASSATNARISVIHTVVPPARLAARLALAEGRPELRGYSPRMLARADETGPGPKRPTGGDARLVEAIDLVSRRLARHGLPWTLAEVIERLGVDRFADRDDVALLESAGIPVDFLRFFAAEGGPSLVRRVVGALREGKSAESLRDELQATPFHFEPTIPGFRVITESGEIDAALVRLQLVDGQYYAAPGDGSALDIARQLVQSLPAARFVACLDAKHVDAFLEATSAWDLGQSSRFQLTAEPFPVAQWAQDNGKTGIVETPQRRAWTLVPRYASRGEDGASFEPNDTFVLESFASLGQSVAQSPLLFQGGNVMCVRDPKSGARILLVGEAEVWRNQSLGLTRDQATDAFNAEFGAERCLVLPALSFHIDYELSVRATDGLVAFVNDTPAAARIVLACGLNALEDASLVTKEAARGARDQLAAGNSQAFMEVVSTALMSRTPVFGQFPESTAKLFQRGAADSGVGNLQRFLWAMDFVTSADIEGVNPAELEIDGHAASYLFSFSRREKERAQLAQFLQHEGFRVVRVPSTSEERRSLNTLNGIHLRDQYLMPAYGGLFEPLDRAARAAFEAALPASVHVVPVTCGESQRRAGALHCAASVVPAL